jgi:hypothetical protein
MNYTFFDIEFSKLNSKILTCVIKMDLKSLDKEAENAALNEIRNMFQRSGQLEKIDQFRNRV